MTVSNVPQTLSFPGPVTVPSTLAITYQFFDAAELDVRSVTAGVESLLMIGTDYTVTGGAGATGAVVPINNILTGTTWTVLRVSKLTQDTDYSAQSTFPEQSHEDALDRITLGQQDLDARVERAVRISPSDDQSADMTLPIKSLRANLFLLFNTAGEPTAATLSDATALPTTSWSVAWMLESTSASARAYLEVIKDGENDWGEGTPITQIIASTNSGRPNAAAAGAGSLLFTNDQLRILLSNGTSWLDVIQERAARADLPIASVVGGRLIGTSDSKEIFIDDGSTGPVKVNIASRGLMQGYLYSYVGVNEAGVGEGECSGNDLGANRFFMASAGMTKLINSTWVTGDTLGGMAAGATLPTEGWIHFFALGHDDGIQVEFGWDTSVIAANLLVDGNVAAANFDASWRRLFSCKTDGSDELRKLNQFADWFYYDDLDALITQDITPDIADALFTLSNAPLGIEALLAISVGIDDTTDTGWSIVNGRSTNVTTRSFSPWNLGRVPMGFNLDNEIGASQVLAHCDTLGRIRSAAGDLCTLECLVTGWMDDRGRYA